MDKEKLEAIIEAVLFTLGSAVEKQKLSEIAGCGTDEVDLAIEALKEKYSSAQSGLMLIAIDEAVQLCTKSELFEYLVKAAKAPKSYTLSDTAIETLSIIAYKQPVTRMMIEHIRGGVDCSHAINRLLEYGLIEERGRMNAPGRPILFGTTDVFLRTFGMESLDDLPKLDSDRMEDFREQAELEAGESLEETVNVDI